MSSLKLALFNVKNNIKLYNFNVISMIVSIAVFFNFFSLIFNPTIKLVSSEQLLIKVTLYMTSILLVFFIAFFIFYSNSFFLKQRKKEIGIYTFMGVDSNKIAKVFALEEIILGIASLVPGLIIGVIFQKAFLMLLTKVAAFDREITFYLSIEGILITCFVFTLLFVLSALRGYVSIFKSKLIDLLNADKYEDKFTNIKYLKGILAAILIVIGAIYSRDIFNENFFTNASIVMFSIIIGTFLFFSSCLSVIIKAIQRRKKILYKGTNIISISNIAYRINNNYKTLACITIVAAATITALGTALAVEHMFKSSIRIQYPYSFSYITENESPSKKVINVINTSKHKVLAYAETEILMFDSEKYTMGTKKHPVVRLSEFNRIINILKPENAEEILKFSEGVKGGYAISLASANDIGFKDNQLLNMYGLNIKVKRTISVPLLGAQFSNDTIVLSDGDYNKFKENCLKLEVPETEIIFHGIIVNNQGASIELYNKLKSMPEVGNRLKAYVTYYNSLYGVTGVVKFTGVFLGIVFILATASIMYMKLMSDAISDKQKYEILIKLGLSERELYKASAKQVGLSYALPLIKGSGYAFLAISAMQEFLVRFYELSLLIPYLVSVGIYSIVYFAFYILTTRKFISLVKL